MLIADLDVTPEQILQEDCITCQAPPGTVCVAPHAGREAYAPYAHPMRRFAAQKTLSLVIREEGRRLRQLERDGLQAEVDVAKSEVARRISGCPDKDCRACRANEDALQHLIDCVTKLARFIV